jgi:predicted amidohydrolase
MTVTVRVAAYQAPLLPAGSTAIAIRLIRERVAWCESEEVDILCCPEAVLGGLADYAARPTAVAIDAEGGALDAVLAPLASDRVTTIVGFTESDRRGRLFNSAAILHKGSVVGVYRKLYPAINRSVYQAGDKVPVFTVGDLTFGILICLDSTYDEPARIMAARGAAALFVPTNNVMPPGRGGPELVVEARCGDIARAIESGVSVVRADVAGRAGDLVSHGSSGIVDRNGTVLGSARPLEADMVVADITTVPRARANTRRLLTTRRAAESS